MRFTVRAVALGVMIFCRTSTPVCPYPYDPYDPYGPYGPCFTTVRLRACFLGRCFIRNKLDVLADYSVFFTAQVDVPQAPAGMLRIMT